MGCASSSAISHPNATVVGCPLEGKSRTEELTKSHQMHEQRWRPSISTAAYALEEGSSGDHDAGIWGLEENRKDEVATKTTSDVARALGAAAAGRGEKDAPSWSMSSLSSSRSADDAAGGVDGNSRQKKQQKGATARASQSSSFSSFLTRSSRSILRARSIFSSKVENGLPAADQFSRTGEEAESEKTLRQAKDLIGLVAAGQPLGSLSEFAKAYADEAFCLRLLEKYNGDVNKCASKLENALRWREKEEKLLTTRSYKESSDLRIIGVDREGRPILYQCARNQTLSGAVILEQYVVKMLDAVDMMIPGMTTMTHVWDMHGLSIWMNLNPAPVLQLLSIFESYFAGRMQQLIIVGLPGPAVFLKDAIWPLVPERTRQKIQFLNYADAKVAVHGLCDEQVASRVIAAMALNRNPLNTLHQRRCIWQREEAAAIATKPSVQS